MAGMILKATFERYIYMWWKLLIFVVAFFPGVSECRPESVSRKEARNIAEVFFRQLHGRDYPLSQQSYNGRNLTTAHLFPPFYLFNSEGDGFVLIPSENKCFPVLAYSKTGELDVKSEQTDSILRRYAREIEAVRYDGRIPVEAVEAWRDPSGYIRRLLDAGGDKVNRFMVSAVEFPDLMKEKPTDGNDVIEEEYEPFSFFDTFIKETSRERDRDRDKPGERYLSMLSSPEIRDLGGGHFDVSLPEPVVMFRLYSLQGLQVGEWSVDYGNVAHVSLDGMPKGYYIIVISGESGKNYGFKLYR